MKKIEKYKELLKLLIKNKQSLKRKQDKADLDILLIAKKRMRK